MAPKVKYVKDLGPVNTKKKVFDDVLKAQQFGMILYIVGSEEVNNIKGQLIIHAQRNRTHLKSSRVVIGTLSREGLTLPPDAPMEHFYHIFLDMSYSKAPRQLVSLIETATYVTVVNRRRLENSRLAESALY